MTRWLTFVSAWLIYIAMTSLYGFSLYALLRYRTEETFWSWGQTWQIVRYSLLQAGISALLATLFGLLLARCFFYTDFKCKDRLYQLLGFIWSLPSLVVIFALIGFWGNRGWLAVLFEWLGWQWSFSLYGLQGIVLAHLVLNIPLVMKYCLEGLALIPSHRHQLAAQLNLRGWRYIQIVELPILRGILPYAFSTVFLLCFTSFPIVLMLGGGPKFSTLEVAIYQAVTFEFDFTKAAVLIFVQLCLGVGLQFLMDIVGKRAFERTMSAKPAGLGKIWRPSFTPRFRLLAYLWLGLMSLVILLPMGSIVWNGLTALSRVSVDLPLLWESFLSSWLLSFISSLTVIFIAYLIALETRRLAYQGKRRTQQWLAGLSTYPLILPIFLLAVGLFLLLMDMELASWQLFLLVGVCNGLTLLPFIYRLIFSAMWQTLVSTDKLSRSLGLKGIKGWWIAEKSRLIRPLAHAFALSMSASLGSFAVIAFFGSPSFSTLPYLLYQQLGSYRMEEAAITALLLMICSLFPFLWIKQTDDD